MKRNAFGGDVAYLVTLPRWRQKTRFREAQSRRWGSTLAQVAPCCRKEKPQNDPLARSMSLFLSLLLSAYWDSCIPIKQMMSAVLYPSHAGSRMKSKIKNGEGKHVPVCGLAFPFDNMLSLPGVRRTKHLTRKQSSLRRAPPKSRDDSRCCYSFHFFLQ